MRPAVNAFATGLGAVVVTLFALLMALILLQVVNRFLLGFQIFWTEEVIRLLLVWTVLLATPLTLLRRHEITVDLLSFSAPALDRGKVALSAAASVVFCLVLAKTGYDFTMRGLNAQSITLGVSRAWFYAPLPIGAALSVLALLVRPGKEDMEGDAAR
ncbi:MAG: TRAP transporter small permease [Pikeienuella sp.]